jgi:hypothetical protein
VATTKKGEGLITPFAVILDKTVAFEGQTTEEFDFKYGGSKERVRVYIENVGDSDFEITITSPSGGDWVENWTIEPGEYFQQEFIFGSREDGEWEITLETPDGSTGVARIKVRDGLTP